MKVAIHQPHYFPWLGYMDKMAKAEKFIVLDEVQLTDRSPMVRNKFLTFNGKEEPLSLSIQKKGYREKKTRDIELFNIKETQKKHRRFFECNYKKANYFDEIMERIASIFECSYHNLLDIEMDTINLIRELLDIKTELIYQSDLLYDKESKKSDLMKTLCSSVNANIYLSGNGARKYMDVESFKKDGIRVVYQNFEYPVYQQFNQGAFVPNLSSVDMLFHLGIKRSQEVFWNNVKKGKEFEGEER